mmetsp:Transcript_37645/g.63337  ORF Transcript_37645/g.63337 Transcript_37645/m.63337 type:complete len:249 (-) Transcript_37645:893-1639(-)
MGDGECGALLEDGADSALEHCVGLHVAAGSGLVQQNDLAPPQQRPRHADELALPVAPVLSVLRHGRVKSALQRLRHLLELHVLQRIPQPLVLRLAVGVEVVPQGAREEGRLLRDDGQRVPQVVQPDGHDVHAVDPNVAEGHVRKPHQGHHHRRLARARAPTDAHLLSWRNLAANIVEHEGQAGAVSEGEVSELDAPVGGPSGGGARVFDHVGGLGRDLGILGDALDTDNLALPIGRHADEPVEGLSHV